MEISSSRFPQGAELDQVSTFGPSGMPVRQGTIDKGKGRYAIAYAFQPGQNGVRISYIVPYADNKAQIRESSTYDSQRVLLVIPPTMQVSSAGFNAAGTEQGFNVFSKEAMKAGTGFDVCVSGTAPPPSEASASQNGPDQVNGSEAPARRRPSKPLPRDWTTKNGFCSEGSRPSSPWAWAYLLRKPVFRKS